LNSAICFCEKSTNTLDGAFFARLDPPDEPLVEPLCELSDGVAAEAGVSAVAGVAASAGVSSLDADLDFFLTFFSLSACKGKNKKSA
jgi:hypothetical protein